MHDLPSSVGTEIHLLLKLVVRQVDVINRRSLLSSQTIWSVDEHLCRSDGRVALVRIKLQLVVLPNKSVDVFLDVLDQSFNNVDLVWTTFNKLFNCIVDLFFVLTLIV